MKHKHHDLIVAWAADTTQVVEVQRANGSWVELAYAPDWSEAETYRFMPVPKPDVVRYLALNVDNVRNIGNEWTERACPSVWGTEAIRIVRDGETGKLKSAEVW